MAITEALAAGCPPEQIEKCVGAGVVLQPRQLAASAAARLCDSTGGPTAIGDENRTLGRGSLGSAYIAREVAARKCVH